MGIEFRPATIDGVGIFVAISGASGSGKTVSALRLARGMAGSAGKVAAIDTESKRMSHYSRDFAFDVYNMDPPFAPDRFVEAARRAEAAGYAALVIDSFSMEWVGAGGVLDQQERELQRLAGNDEAKRSKHLMQSWIAPKRQHKAMMNAFLQLRMPVVFCLRAEDKKVPVNLGWTPVQDKRFIYEWTISLTLHPESPGQIRFDLPHKAQKQHRAFLTEGALVDESVGVALHRWAHSDVGPPSTEPSAKQTADRRKADEFAAGLTESVRAATAVSELRASLAQSETTRKLQKLRESYPTLHDGLMAAVDQRERELAA